MDIKKRIEHVIDEKGLTKKEVAVRMGKFNQAINSLITNPKWDTIEQVAKALGMSTCELIYGIKLEESDTLQRSQDAAVDDLQQTLGQAGNESADEQKQEPAASEADELPFADDQQEQRQEQPALTPDIAFICPHCHEAIKLGFIR